jgi:hypothetical protein
MSFMRLARHGITKLPVDVNGIPDGPDFETFLTVRELRARQNVRSFHPGVWSGRAHHLASLLEIHVKLGLEANPFVLSIREGYPYVGDEVYEALHLGETVLRNQVPTVDFVLTMAPLTPGGPLRYRAGSVKPHAELRPEDFRLEARLTKFFSPLGWERARLLRPTRVACANYLKLWDWGRHHPLDDGAQDAKQMAKLLLRSESKRPLWSVLASTGKKLGIGQGDEYFVFAAAFYLGYIGIDQTLELDEELSLVQTRPPVLLYG